MTEKQKFLELYSVGAKPHIERISLSVGVGEKLGIVAQSRPEREILTGILSGRVRTDCGEILLFGESIRSAEDIATLSVWADDTDRIIEDISIAENIFLGAFGDFERAFTLDTSHLACRAHAMLERVGLYHVDPHIMAGELSIGERRLCELARLMRKEVPIIVLNCFLDIANEQYRARISRVLDSFRLRGGAVVMLTGDPTVATAYCDRVIYMRDGVSTDVAKVVQTGEDFFGEGYGATTDILLRAVNMCCDGISNVSFKLFAGETLGVVGRRYSGVENIGRAIYGDISLERGRVSVHGHSIKSIKGAIKRGIVYVGASFGFEECVERLSGAGEIYIVDFVCDRFVPSQKSEIFGLVRKICARGGGVIYLSDSLEDTMSVSDRILVVSDGRITSEAVHECGFDAAALTTAVVK